MEAAEAAEAAAATVGWTVDLSAAAEAAVRAWRGWGGGHSLPRAGRSGKGPAALKPAAAAAAGPEAEAAAATVGMAPAAVNLDRLLLLVRVSSCRKLLLPLRLFWSPEVPLDAVPLVGLELCGCEWRDDEEGELLPTNSTSPSPSLSKSLPVRSMGLVLLIAASWWGRRVTTY